MYNRRKLWPVLVILAIYSEEFHPKIKHSLQKIYYLLCLLSKVAIFPLFDYELIILQNQIENILFLSTVWLPKNVNSSYTLSPAAPLPVGQGSKHRWAGFGYVSAPQVSKFSAIASVFRVVYGGVFYHTLLQCLLHSALGLSLIPVLREGLSLCFCPSPRSRELSPVIPCLFPWWSGEVTIEQWLSSD